MTSIITPDRDSDKIIFVSDVNDPVIHSVFEPLFKESIEKSECMYKMSVIFSGESQKASMAFGKNYDDNYTGERVYYSLNKEVFEVVCRIALAVADDYDKTNPIEDGRDYNTATFIRMDIAKFRIIQNTIDYFGDMISRNSYTIKLFSTVVDSQLKLIIDATPMMRLMAMAPRSLGASLFSAEDAEEDEDNSQYPVCKGCGKRHPPQDMAMVSPFLRSASEEDAEPNKADMKKKAARLIGDIQLFTAEDALPADVRNKLISLFYERVEIGDRGKVLGGFGFRASGNNELTIAMAFGEEENDVAMFAPEVLFPIASSVPRDGSLRNWITAEAIRRAYNWKMKNPNGVGGDTTVSDVGQELMTELLKDEAIMSILQEGSSSAQMKEGPTLN